MKKNLFLVAVLCILTYPILNGQLNQGGILVGLSSGVTYQGEEGPLIGPDLLAFGFSSFKYNGDVESKMSFFNLQPKAGYFVIDNLAVGLNVFFSTFKYKDPDDSDSWGVTAVGAGPFARYYLPQEKFYPFVELNTIFGTSKYKESWGDGEYEDDWKYSLMGFGAGVGLAMPLGDRVTFDTMIGYSSITSKEKGDDEDKQVIGNFGLKMGFVVYFNLK